jgi:transcriptional regulator with XRE-family HTH domain
MTKRFHTRVWVSNAGAVAGADKRFQSEEIAMRFGENLRRIRRREGFSQEELAERAYLHRTEVGLIERGQRVGRIDTLIKLAGALSVSPLELLDGIHWTVADPRRGQFSFSGPREPARRRGDRPA